MDKVKLTLDERAIAQLHGFIDAALERNSQWKLRSVFRDDDQYVKRVVAHARMRAALLARLDLRLSVASLKRNMPMRLSVPIEEALALVAEWTGPLSDMERGMLSVAEVVGTIDKATA